MMCVSKRESKLGRQYHLVPYSTSLSSMTQMGNFIDNKYLSILLYYKTIGYYGVLVAEAKEGST